MRPPEHWHSPRRQRSVSPWGVVAAIAAVLVVVLAFVCVPSGEDTSSTASGGCAVFDTCTPAPTSQVLASTAAPALTGGAAAVLEAPCGALIYGLNEEVELPPASLTKMMTAIVVADEVSLERAVNVRVNSELLVASTGSTVMGLQPGLQMSVRDLLYGLLLASGNDAAIALAQEVGGSEAAFVELMNDTAGDFDLEHTRFTNPHGLDQAGLYMSAEDAARLGSEVLARPDLAAIVGTLHYQPVWDGPEVWNSNELLSLYPEAMGVKIGYTEQAGQTIVAAAERGGRQLIVSVLGAWDRYSDAINLLEWAFANTESAC
jgi:D-alanyl-D-alanine carboxypeptidase